MYAGTCYMDKLTDQVVMDVQVEVIELLINAFTIVHTPFSYSYCVRVFARSENDYYNFHCYEYHFGLLPILLGPLNLSSIYEGIKWFNSGYP